MDLDQVLFGLDPFITDILSGKPVTNEVFKESFITLLSQLAVLLREPKTRDEKLFKDNIVNFVATLAKLLNDLEARDITLEVLKVLINGVADNNENRDKLLDNDEVWESILKFLNDEFNDDEVNERIFLMIQNLIVEDVEIGQGKGKYLEKVARLLAEKLFWYLQYNPENQLGIEVFVDLIQVSGSFKSDATKIETVLNKLISVLEKYKNKDFITDDDGTDEVIVNYSKILESLTLDLDVKFNQNFEVKLQNNLLKVFKVSEGMEIPNKLKFQRQIYASLGNISSNYTASNKLELGSLEKENEHNGYIISSVCLILGNSIGSAEDRALVLESHPNLIPNMVSKFQYFTDPILFQGFLQLLKNVISMQNYNQLFENFSDLKLIIEAILTNSKYYPNLNSLFTALLKKLLVFINRDQLTQLLTLDQITSIDGDQTIVPLILNKLIIYKSQDESLLNKLISKTMKITQSPQIEISTLFELTKTIGLLSSNVPDLLLDNYKEEITTLLTSIDQLQEQNGAINAVKNNGRYISGNLLEKSNGQLEQVCRNLLKDL